MYCTIPGTTPLQSFSVDQVVDLMTSVHYSIGLCFEPGEKLQSFSAVT